MSARASDTTPPPIAQASIDPSGAPHLALLLPTGSGAFARPAEAVRAGFLEAWKKQTPRTLPVRLYAVNDDPQHVLAVYRQALVAGAQMVVGPLTRNGVTALASAPNLLTVPTLALNVPERVAARPSNFYMLSLQVEGEARQIAQLALGEGRRRALTITDQTALARRMRDAFAEEYKRGGGYHIADYAYTNDTAGLERIKQASGIGVADMIFLALDAPRLRALRSVISAIPAYGTSQLNAGFAANSDNPDIPDVRFVDMPWMVQPDHPAVMVYARGAAGRQTDDIERLYALGIDAFRVAQELLAGKRDIDIDGVTGRLRLGADGQFRRGLLLTLVSGGRVTVLGESRP